MPSRTAARAVPAPPSGHGPAGGGEVELAHVHRSFGSVIGLADLSLSVVAGSITVMVGPNGAGKTTALRVITGALAPERGTVTVFGLQPAGPEGEHVRRRCGVVAAKPALYDRLSVRDNLRYAAELFGLGAGSSGLLVGAVAWMLAVLGLMRGARAVTRARLLGVDRA